MLVCFLLLAFVFEWEWNTHQLFVLSIVRIIFSFLFLSKFGARLLPRRQCMTFEYSFHVGLVIHIPFFFYNLSIKNNFFFSFFQFFSFSLFFGIIFGIFLAALPEVILRNCRNCSPQQAQNAQKLTNFLQTRYPDVWAMLIRKYRGV